MSELRKKLLSRPIYHWARGVLPKMSATEREAIEAGDVWWDADLFTGNPNWQKLLDTKPAKLSAEEQAFIDGPVDELCAMLDDWKINWELRDLPPEVWDFLKSRKFFGMIIPKEYGGLGFSAFAHSEVVRKISTRSISAAVTAMVPNSLGPGELLMQFGTKEQRDHWLPRLADGREIPCFGLTSPEAGSDAASMIDIGVVCHGRHKGSETLGIRLNWHKRYITLGPVATVLGLAFKLHDPDHLLGEVEERGITVALIPTDTPGVEIGRRHLPSMQIFQNGPNKGNDVFVPLDAIIGGPERAGQGWQMLMSALAAGRGISLPSLSAAGAAFSAHTSGAYARLRNQFGIPVGKFEGIQEPLARIAGTAYMLDAARRLTCAGLDQGHKPSVISAIMKSQATERMRAAVNDAMDIHAGKAVIDGPLNYLGSLYRSLPVAITVEGANILTRSLIVFGQGAIRSHPFLLKEMLALGDENEERGVDQFDRFFWQHLRHGLATAFRAFGRALTGGRFAPAPSAGGTAHFYSRLGRYSAAFALTSDMALLTMGGALKRKEMLSGRLGDILSELYLLSAVLKRWEDEGRQEDDLPIVAWCMETGFATMEKRLDEVLVNFPNRPAAWLLRLFTLPFGVRNSGPADEATQACAEILLTPSTARDRLTPGIFHGPGNEGLNRLDTAFALLADTQAIATRMHKAGIDDWQDAQKRGIITAEEARQLALAAEAAAKVVEVDDFAPADLSPRLNDKNKQEMLEAVRQPRRGFY
ncbi:MAG: acyl-CoA dehydrogenase [Parvibaculum sp.]|uniref:acyl-CoA dehydrogenase n=1 Tax=Parvibaculum sp. TaxID=2024848 RepID=UPI0025E0F5E5|nr:acyl-CoA dehydrogenase [Parvibaculum sp.]MCE9650276.1 acyl-CoA dehydrogenase [Parvibaculum sp.]